MSGRENDGPAESLRRRIASELRSRGEDPSVGLQRYAVERFLYRLGRSPHRERFVLKGATVFTVWTGEPHRATRDVDLLSPLCRHRDSQERSDARRMGRRGRSGHGSGRL